MSVVQFILMGDYHHDIHQMSDTAKSQKTNSRNEINTGATPAKAITNIIKIRANSLRSGLVSGKFGS